MSFVKKTFLYAFLFFIISFQTGNAQEFIKPKLLLEHTQGAQFYSFENNTLSLYMINQSSEYSKIWEYQFLNKKQADLVSILHGDIKGGPEKEIVTVMHSFGSQGELYIFSIEKNKPLGAPEILKIPTTKEGTKPTQAKLINWDQQEKKEILLSCSSPERELFVLDYYNNKLEIITTLASDFMTSTYGPIKIFITDKNKDKIDDVFIYSTNDKVEEYALLSTQEAKTKQLPQEIDFSTLTYLKKNNNMQALSLTKEKDTIYSIADTQTIETSISNIVSLVAFTKDNLLVLTDDNQLIELPQSKQTKTRELNALNLPFQEKTLDYIINKSNKAALFVSPQEQKIVFITFSPMLTQKELQETTTTSQRAQSTPNQKTKSHQTTKIKTKHDTLYVNVGNTIIIPITKPDSLNIESVETQIKPATMNLDPQALEFVWTPTAEKIGPQAFEYLVSYTSDAQLKQTTNNKKQVALQNVFETINEKHLYTIYVNDVPRLIINNLQDTIHTTGFFETDYHIVDKYHLEAPIAKTAETSPNKMLINNKTVYWEPEKRDAGEKTFLIIADDGMAQDTALISIFIDTTIKKLQYDFDFTTTVNENFVHQLPYIKGTNYNVLQGPDNLRISPKGKIYWVPIITQVDMNTVVIEAQRTQQTEQHTLDIYVNAPPVISYQPAAQEAITQGEKFQFQFQSFDMNTDANLQWTNISNEGTPRFIISQFGMLEFKDTEELDNFTYVVHLSDKIDKDIFIGELYINMPPKILSTPENHIQFGETYQYILQAEDNNKQKPYQENKPNKLYYAMPVFPKGALFNIKKRTLSWTPTKEQVGKNAFMIEVTDSIDFIRQDFSVFVNDKPNIVSPDSLEIMLGDTLFHYFDAQDLNQDSELLYTIKTTIDEILFSGKMGKLVWIPKEEDLGFHTLEISVSDGFNTGRDMQKLKIFVYKNPFLLNMPKQDAFVNMAYQFRPKGQDMFLDSISNQDVFFDISSSDSLFSGKFDPIKNTLSWTPSIAEIGEHDLSVTVVDKYKHTNQNAYSITVMLSPCETLQVPCEGLDTLVVNKIDTIEKTIIDSVFIEKKDTVYIDKKQTTKTNNRNKWKPKGLGF